MAFLCEVFQYVCFLCLLGFGVLGGGREVGEWWSGGVSCFGMGENFREVRQKSFCVTASLLNHGKAGHTSVKDTC